jgi:DnaJ family protein C protein 9
MYTLVFHSGIKEGINAKVGIAVWAAWMGAEEGRSLYDILGVSSGASQTDIRVAYKKLCLQLHPDKAGKSEEARARFQQLQRVYAVLSDPDRRKLYDEHGIASDADGNDVFSEPHAHSADSLYCAFRRALFEVTDDEIERFEQEYRFSDEEVNDLLRHYCQFRGDMRSIFAHVICSDESLDSHRFADAIDDAISAGRVPRYEPYSRWRKRIHKRARPTEADERRTSKRNRGADSSGNTSALVAMIHSNQRKRSAVDSVTQRWSIAAGADGPPDLSETEFQAAQARLSEGGNADVNASNRGKRRARR